MRMLWVLSVLALLSGCAAVGAGADRVAQAVNTYCDQTTPLGREALRAEINARLAERGRSVVVDCGTP